MYRRSFCTRVSAAGLALIAPVGSIFAQANAAKASWLSDALTTRASNSPLQLARFREPIWVLLRPISWKPSTDEQRKVKAVTVPKNFVTDLASIPTEFCALLPRDAEYAYPAIVHDYLYWSQIRPKAEADMIFKWSMEDLEVTRAKITAIYQGVARLGGSAWEANAKLKREGEKRILRVPPPTARTKWSEWKTQPERFV